MSAVCTNEEAILHNYIESTQKSLIITSQSCFHDAILKNASFVSSCIARYCFAVSSYPLRDIIMQMPLSCMMKAPTYKFHVTPKDT